MVERETTVVPAKAPNAEAGMASLRNRKTQILLSIVLVVLVLVYSFTTELVPSESMLPTLKPGDHMLTMRAWLAYFGGRLPARGDIIVFTLPKEQSTGDPGGGRSQIGIFRTRGEVLVKRVAGLPGESIRVQNNNDVTINGVRVDLPGERQPADLDPGDPGPYGTHEPLKLGPDEIFVLGDNRNISEDSRAWGPLKRDRVVGKFVRVLFHTKPPQEEPKR